MTEQKEKQQKVLVEMLEAEGDGVVLRPSQKSALKAAINLYPRMEAADQAIEEMRADQKAADLKCQMSDKLLAELQKELEKRDGNMLSDAVTVMQTLLQRILKSLKVLGCGFHLCDGSQTPPREHVTCRVCAASWEVAEAIGVIERDYGGPRKEKEPGSDDKEIVYGGDPEPAQDT